MTPNRTHLERFVSIIPLPYYWGAAIIGALLFLISAGVLVFFEGSFIYIWPCFILGTLVALQCAFISWAHEKIRFFRDILIDMVELPETEILKWHRDQEGKVFNDMMMILVGVGITVIAHELGLDYFGFSFNSFYSYATIKFDYYLAHYLMGAGLYVWIATALMIYNLGKLPLDINVILSKNIRFKGVVYSKFTICAVIVYIAWGGFHLSTPARFSSMQSMLWFSSFALLLLAYFILPQYNIHQIMVKTKKKKLEVFSSKLRQKAEETFRDPTEENFLYLDSMLGVQQRLDEMCAWPFGSYEVLHIALIVIVPLMVLIFEVVREILR